MSDLKAFSGQGTNNFATATLSLSGQLTWNPAAPDFSQCDGLQIDEPATDPTKSLTIWFAVDRGSVTLIANGFPTFNITTPLAPLPQISLTFSDGQWRFSTSISGLKPGPPQAISFVFPADNTGPLPASQTLSVQFTPNLVSAPPSLQVDVTSQNQPWNVMVEIVAMPDPSQWALRVSTTAAILSGQFWKGFGTTEDLTLYFTYLPGLTAILKAGPYSRAFVELSGFSSDVAGYWNNQIAQPYLLSVPAAEPDAPISAVWTIPQGAAPWSYCAYISNLGILTQGPNTGDLGIVWQPGCFTLPSGASVDFSLPDFLVHSGNSFQGTATLLRADPDTTLTDQLSKRVANSSATIVFIAFRVATLTPAGSQMVRLGALDLIFAARSSSPQNEPWHVLGYVEPAVNQSLPKYTHPRIVVQGLELTIIQVQVGSEDPLPNQIEESPVVIPLTPAGTGLYWLLIAESNPFGLQRSMTLTLIQNQGSSGSVSLLVLDRNPFLVARVNLPSLLGSATAANALVAEWSNTYAYGEGWHSQSGAQTFTVWLPPQGLGEAIERGKDISPGSNVDYRFSPAAQVDISPPVLAGTTENYFEAPWNLRRLLASPGQNVPGSPTPSFAAEFAYGLPVTVTSSALRIAEITALTGRLAGPLPSTNTTSKQWNDIVTAFQTRLSVLVPWDGVDPGSLQLSDEAAYRLRAGADLAAPEIVPPGVPPYPTGGLKGGIAWIFESENIYRSIWQQLQSTSALLTDPALSALGGWAKQRAVFLNGVTAINSHVEMGRISTISVEQIGRVGVLWNHAKHVTVFERTVQASDQFANSQDPLQGQPIIRKVLEYVELLQPVRSYPESGADAVNVAFVQGSEFKSKIIYVDSSWGSDVPSGGWQVPLWMPGADPSIYPKPHIVLDFAVDPATRVASQGQEIAEPQKLVFYTTGNAGPDTDLWPPALNVDYADVDTTVQAPRTLTSQTYRLAIQPGTGAFTWSLAPAKFSTNVVAQRTTSAISAALNNVSMMRSKPVSQPATPPPPLLALQQVQDQANSLIQEIGNYLSTDNLSNIVTKRVLGPYLNQLTQVAASAIPVPNVNTSVQSLVSAASASFEQLTANAADLFATVVQAIRSATATDIVTTSKAQAKLLDSLLGNLTQTTLGKALRNAIQDLAKITAATPSQAAITASFQNDTTLQLLQPLQTVVMQSVSAVALDLAPLASIGAGPILPGWVQSATLEAFLALPISELLNGVLNQSDVNTALSNLAAYIATASSALQTLANNVPILTLDPGGLVMGGPTLATIGNLQDAQNWLKSVASANAIGNAVTNAQNLLTGWISTNGPSWIPSPQQLQSALTTIASNFANMLQTRVAMGGQLTNFQNQFKSTIGSFLAAGTHLASTAATAYNSIGDPALRLFRAFGDAPVAPGLSFSLPEFPPEQSLDQLAYFFDHANPNVAITNGVQSALAAAAQALPTLSPVNLNVPIASLLDRLVPDPNALLQNAISSIFPNLAGMSLSTLFAGLMPPINAPDGIQIRHSINPQTLQIEVDADIDIKFADDAVVLDAGPVILTLLNPRFQATVKIEVQDGRQPVEQVTGIISGSWELNIAGLTLVTFVNTSLTFDQSGHIRFDVSPEKVQLASVMQFIADLINSLGSPGSGLSIRFNPDPVAVVSNLDLPLPDIAGGVFALSNIRLGALFSIGLDSSNNFQFSVGMNLSQEDAPFAIVIFILGGGGWVTAQMTYTATSGATPQVMVTVGISAIASLEIALGPVSGGVMISFSLFATYSTNASLDLGIVICIAGHVSLLDIIEADITLLLEADYDSGQLTGRGSVSVDIQICWCFTLSIHQEVEYQFGNRQGGAGGTRAVALGRRVALLARSAVSADDDPFWTAASEYIDMLAA